MSDGPLIAGIELGGTKCVAILARGPTEIETEVRLPTADPAETLPALRAEIDGWRAQHEIAAIGIASFGPLSLHLEASDFGHMARTPKAGWSGADLLGTLVPDDLPARLDTDVNGAALAEGRWGAARGLNSFAYVTVGTGVGVGSIVNGAPVAGLGHSEAGHLLVRRMVGDSWGGTCPFHGDCVEGLASGTAIAAAAGERAELLPDDHPALLRSAVAIAGLCHNLALTSVPERILIGGGVAAGRPGWVEDVRLRVIASLNGYAIAESLSADDRYVTPPALGRRAGPLGAIALGLAALEPRKKSNLRADLQID